MIARSYLYVPGNAPDKLERAFTRGADALIVDLEDAVPAAVKDQARQITREWLSDGQAQRGTCQVWVRVNPGQMGLTDIREVATSAVTGFILAKSQSPADVEQAAQVLDEVEQAVGLAPGQIALVPLLESAAALLDARQIARHPRVVRLQVGESDLAADMGLTPGPDERELDGVRSRTVMVSAALGLNPPAAPVSTNFRDLEAFEASTRQLARMGFAGRACIHPAQIAVANSVFTPTDEQVQAATRLIGEYEASLAHHQGAFTSSTGQMIDEAVVRSARRVLERAQNLA